MKAWSAWIAAGLIGLTGCGGNSPTGTVLGKITLSGKPLPSGKIVFRSPEGMGDDREATIEGGRFKVEKLPVGPQRVEVIGVKGVTAKTQGNGTVLEVKPGDQELELKLGT